MAPPHNWDKNGMKGSCMSALPWRFECRSAPTEHGVPALVSCLCVTEGRAVFRPWLWWNFAKQTHGRSELVVVDGSARPAAPEDPRVRVLRVPPGTGIAAKRNIALAAARGSIIAWFDDDDWQHPRRLSLLAAALGEGKRLAGSSAGWFVDPVSRRARPYRSGRDVIFNGLGAWLADTADVRFDENKTKASDTTWVREMSRRARPDVAVVPDVLTWWLCHRGNVSNPVGKYTYPQALSAVRAQIGETDWGDTDDHMAALVARLQS
ncbi:glycosyltransferase family 2 protein [Actinomadura sp. 21ATH]|uniref:glycosyltransferase family 2 protein n=1 Tax=Actinomadura sp. 21ATH TaxID=1735444 RepID=UPI0035BF9A76